MSTVISNGYRLAPGTSVTAFARTLESVFEEARHKAIVTAVGDLVFQIDGAGESEKNRLSTLKFATNNQVDFGRISVRPSRSTVSIARDVLFEYQDSFRKRFATRSPSLDLTLSITFISEPSNPDEIYALVYTEVDEYIKAWESIEGVSEYFYWNNSDSQLERMTRKEWKSRGKKWEVLTANKAPSRNGVSWELDTFPIAIEEIDDAEIVTAVADAELKRAAAIEWAKRVFGDSPEWGHIFNEDSVDKDKEEE